MFVPVWKSFQLLAQGDKKRFAFLVSARVVVQFLDLLGLAGVSLLGGALGSDFAGSNQLEIAGRNFSVDSPFFYPTLAGLIAAIFFLKSIIGSLLLRATTRFLSRVEAESAIAVAKYLFTGGLGRLREQSESEHIWMVGQSSHLAFSQMLFAGSSLVTEGSLFLFVLGAFVWVDPVMASGVAAYFVILVGVFQSVINTKVRRIGKLLTEMSVKSNQEILNLGASYREIFVGNKVEFYLDRFATTRKSYAEQQGRHRYIVGLPRFVIESALMFGGVLLLAWQFYLGDPTSGFVSVGVFLAGGARIMAAILPLQNAITEIRTFGPQALTAQEVLSKVKQAQQLDKSNPGPILEEGASIGPNGLGVVLDKVSFSYSQNAAETISEVSMTIDPGAFVAVVGPSGAGKTTLVDLILGLIIPRAGRIKVGGLPPKRIQALHNGLVAYVPQRPGIVSGSIAENVALGLPKLEIDENRVHECLVKAGLHDFVANLEDGVWTVLNKRKDSLSVGQAQRLGIARALYSKPKLLVLDEATSALDAQTEDEVSKSFSALSGEVTIIVIAHRLSTIQDADVVYVLDHGQLLGSGTFDEVRRAIPMVENFVKLMEVKSGGDPKSFET